MSAKASAQSAISFRWTCAFMGTIEYEVYGDGPVYSVELRREAGEYERSIYNGTEEEWQRDVVGAINVLRRKYDVCQPIDSRVVEAFNAWRKADHEERLAQILAQPEKYGELPENDPLRIPPPVVRGGHYEVGKGLVIQGVATAESDAEESVSPLFSDELEIVGPSR